ncbi:hypothetical protein SLEP1_g30610 [Rubroshorea leprosula]|uniref:Uncharacterized protein n=1 Tax=Rubroshorea leprosula TaxID=152421 RepID=A0AAV5K8W9_9ROSI|nr:hypothetical protein SLEP1_g30610 [Rubroshorea leprosula]
MQKRRWEENGLLGAKVQRKRSYVEVVKAKTNIGSKEPVHRVGRFRSKKGDFWEENWKREMKEIKTRDSIEKLKTWRGGEGISNLPLLLPYFTFLSPELAFSPNQSAATCPAITGNHTSLLPSPAPDPAAALPIPTPCVPTPLCTLGLCPCPDRPLATPALHAAPAPLLPTPAPSLALHFPLCTPSLCAPDPALCAFARAQPVPLLPALRPDRLHSAPRSPAIIPPANQQSCPCNPPAAAPNPPLPPAPLYCCTEPVPPALYAPIPCPCLLHTTAIQKKTTMPDKIGIIDD